MSTREKSRVTWGGTEIPYAIRRSLRRKKTVAVTVEPEGRVLVVAPSHLETEALGAIVSRKAPWLTRRLEHVRSLGAPRPPREFVSGESVLYLGKKYRLKVLPGAAGEAKLRGGWLRVPAPSGTGHTAHVRASVETWFRKHAAKRLPERVEEWLARVGVRRPEVVISDQQKRWGSCDSVGTVRLNWRIIQAPMRLVDYVVVHELIHLNHRGHGSEYWQAFGRVMPDYESRRAALRDSGPGLAWK